MRYPSLSGVEIEKKLGAEGRMLVAMNEHNELVGTAAIIPKETTLWFGKHEFAYCCFAAVLPEYNGKGVYKEMCRIQEDMERNMGLHMMLFDTHEKNVHNISNSIKAGYRAVDIKHYDNHYNVVMVKWLDGCPYSPLQCRIHFLKRQVIVHFHTFLKCALMLS